MSLHPSESINNMGTLRCDIIDGTDLPAADRNGFSDPYCKIILNGAEVYKTSTQKKTLNPKWNESFEIPIPSRTAAKFRVEVFDRDLGDKDDFLGAAEAQLQLLDPFQSQDVRLRLDGQSGMIRIKLLFRSDYVTRKRQGSATFSGTFHSPNRLAGAPAKGVSKTASFFSRGLRRKTNGELASTAEDGDFGTNNIPLATIDSAEERTGQSQMAQQQPPIVVGTSPSAMSPRLPPAQPNFNPPYSASNKPNTSTPNDYNNNTDTSSILTARAPPAAEQGTTSFTIISATGFSGHSVRAYIKQATALGGKREVHKTKSAKASPEGVVYWGEADVCKIGCAADAVFTLQLKDVHTFGADEDYGEAQLAVTGGIGAQQTVRVGKGSVLVRTEWKGAAQVMDGGNDSVSNLSLSPSMAGEKSPGDEKSPRSRLRKSFARN